MSGNINVPLHLIGASGHLSTRVGHRETEYQLPVVSSGYATVGISLPAAYPLKAVYLVDPAPPGDCTISYPSGKAAIAAGATAVVITNTLVTTATMCFVSKLTLDATATDYKAVCTSNTITITANAAATADTYFYFFIVQQVAP